MFFRLHSLRRFIALTAALLLPALLAPAQEMPTTRQVAVAATDTPLDLVSILQGTNSNIGYSHGGTLPLVGTPWPMTHWSAMSNKGSWENGDGWYFNPGDKALVGFRATHQPSPWMGDWGQFVLMPQTGELVTKPDDRKSPYNAKSAVFRPDYMKLDLTRYDVTGELTATSRCALLRLTYREGDAGRLLIDPAPTGHVEIDGRTIRGYTTYGAGRGAPKNFKSYFVIKLDRDPTAVGTFDGDDVKRDAVDVTGKNVGGFVEFDVGDNRTVNLRVANSFISYEQAERNLKQEADGGFDAVRQRVAGEWNKSLNKMTVEGGTAEQRRTFYSCLYRAQTFPHKLYEVGEDGKPVHYGFYDAKAQLPGVLYGDVGFWDVYRTNFSFWALAYPAELGEILEGFNNAYRESGWFPQWPSPGRRGGMIGSHVDAVMADAIVKGIRGFDYETAYEGIRKNAFGDADGKNEGRPGFEWYDKLGYVPDRKVGYSVSASLDYAYDDWCVAQAAKRLGKMNDYDLLMKRSQNYRKLFDKETGFFRARDEDGQFVAPFDPLAWGGAYVEGGPWQCSWAVQHDPEGLAELLGGKGAMLDRLDKMLGMPPAYHTGDYGGEIHEMTEMGHINFGQLSQGNQPVHHILYFFAELGQPWKTQYWTRRALAELYNSGPDGFPGDEDNGEQASWYLLNAMGVYPFCVGLPGYDLSAPLFDKLTLRLPGDKTFTITAEHNGLFNPYVQSRTLDGEPFDGERLGYGQIMNGGELVVDLGGRPPADVRP